jgi:hypothetical protein
MVIAMNQGALGATEGINGRVRPSQSDPGLIEGGIHQTQMTGRGAGSDIKHRHEGRRGQIEDRPASHAQGPKEKRLGRRGKVNSPSEGRRRDSVQQSRSVFRSATKEIPHIHGTLS